MWSNCLQTLPCLSHSVHNTLRNYAPKWISYVKKIMTWIYANVYRLGMLSFLPYLDVIFSLRPVSTYHFFSQYRPQCHFLSDSSNALFPLKSFCTISFICVQYSIISTEADPWLNFSEYDAHLFIFSESK